MLSAWSPHSDWKPCIHHAAPFASQQNALPLVFHAHTLPADGIVAGALAAKVKKKSTLWNIIDMSHKCQKSTLYIMQREPTLTKSVNECFKDAGQKTNHSFDNKNVRLVTHHDTLAHSTETPGSCIFNDHWPLNYDLSSWLRDWHHANSCLLAHWSDSEISQHDQGTSVIFRSDFDHLEKKKRKKKRSKSIKWQELTFLAPQ